MATEKAPRPPAPQVADRHDPIRVHGARVNNLEDLVAARSTLTGEHLAAYVGT